jgi:aminoglycoside 6'-N-acetyltransferase
VVRIDDEQATREDTGERAPVGDHELARTLVRWFVALELESTTLLPTHVETDGHSFEPRWVADASDLVASQRAWLRHAPGRWTPAPRFERLADESLSVRALRDDVEDFEALGRWFSDSRVLQWYGGESHRLDAEGARRRYGERMRKGEIHPALIEHGDRPLGYLQYYEVEDLGSYGLDDGLQPTWAVDMLIGEPEAWGQGLGSRALGLVLRFLLEARGAARVLIDPFVGNDRAIAAYEKAGFRRIRILRDHELHDGARRDVWLMIAAPPMLELVSKALSRS